MFTIKRYLLCSTPLQLHMLFSLWFKGMKKTSMLLFCMVNMVENAFHATVRHIQDGWMPFHATVLHGQHGWKCFSRYCKTHSRWLDAFSCYCFHVPTGL